MVDAISRTEAIIHEPQQILLHRQRLDTFQAAGLSHKAKTTWWIDQTKPQTSTSSRPADSGQKKLEQKEKTKGWAKPLWNQHREESHMLPTVTHVYHQLVWKWPLGHRRRHWYCKANLFQIDQADASRLGHLGVAWKWEW